MTKRTHAPISVAAVIVAVVALLLSGCTSSKSNWDEPGTTPGAGAPSSPKPVGDVTILPAASSAPISPSDAVSVTASGGATLTSVTLTAGTKSVPGSLSADGTTWTPTGTLAYNTTYTLTVTSSAGTTTRTFSTVKPTKTVKATLAANKMLALKNGATYGVGQPIIVNFGKSIPTSQRKAVTDAITVQATPAVEGRWHWVSSTEVDYRGENYWAAHSTITVSSKLVGIALSKGVYVANNVHATIHIGDSHVLEADNNTHQMKLYINGTLTKTIPVSMGMGGSTKAQDGSLVNYWTRTGPHIVIRKDAAVTMSSASYGITDPNSPYFYAPETVKDAVRISYSGEFVHLRTWTVGDLGKRNSSHGCINVGIAYAPYLYNLLITGDIVDVTGTPVKVSFANTQADWEIPWSQW